MVCPRCNSELIETVKHGVVIDHCSTCGGIWLDKGELAKILSQIREAEASLDEEFRPLWKDRHEYYDKYRYKKKSRFEKIFDIFD